LAATATLWFIVQKRICEIHTSYLNLFTKKLIDDLEQQLSDFLRDTFLPEERYKLAQKNDLFLFWSIEMKNLLNSNLRRSIPLDMHLCSIAVS